MRHSPLLLLALLVGKSAAAITPDFHAYLRASAGMNGKGGKQECIRNPGTSGNEFRLGHECGIYGEALLAAPLLKESETQPYLVSQLRLAFTPPGSTVFERFAGGAEPALAIAEAYLEAGRYNGSPLTFWAGKRFYRDVDFVLNDWFYFGHMSGNGLGLGGIPALGGTIALAGLFESSADATSVGLAQKQYLDVRWQQIPIAANSQLNFWAAAGRTPSATKEGKDYVGRTGFAFGTRWRRNFWEGSHDLAVVYGRGLMQNLEIFGPALLEKKPDDPEGPERLRLVSALNVQPSRHYGVHAGATFETWNPHVPGRDERGYWWNVGARNVFFLSKHWQLAVEAGHSVIRDRAERNEAGVGVGERHLTRLTLAPMLAIDRTLTARPTLRFIYSYSFWNEANRAPIAKGREALYGGATAGTNIGVQTELWF